MAVNIRTLANRNVKIYMRPDKLKECHRTAKKICYGVQAKRNRRIGGKRKRGILTEDFIAAFIIAFHAGPDYAAYGSYYPTYSYKSSVSPTTRAGQNRSLIDMFLLLHTHYGYEIDIFLDGIFRLLWNIEEGLYNSKTLRFGGLKCNDISRYVFSFRRHGDRPRLSVISGGNNFGWHSKDTDSGIYGYTLRDLVLVRDRFIKDYYENYPKHKFELAIYK